MTIFSAEVKSQMEFDFWVCSIQSNINFCLYDRTELNKDPDHFNVTEKLLKRLIRLDKIFSKQNHGPINRKESEKLKQFSLKLETEWWLKMEI